MFPSRKSLARTRIARPASATRHLRRLATALSALTLGCGDGPLASHSTLPAGFGQLYGRWTWVRSCCDISGAATTPASEGYAMFMEFERPNTLRTWRDAELLSTTSFDVRLERQQGRTVALLTGAGEQAVAEIRLRADTLELIRNCADCASDRFER